MTKKGICEREKIVMKNGELWEKKGCYGNKEFCPGKNLGRDRENGNVGGSKYVEPCVNFRENIELW
jgi:hypothetical protein